MSTVTLEKAHFDTLLRRTNFYATGLDLPPVDLPMVTIPRLDYERYIEIIRQFETLKQVLYSGGIEDEAFKLLISGGQQSQEQYDATTTTAEETSDGGFLTQAYQSEVQTSCNHGNASNHKHGNGYQIGTGREKVTNWSEHPEDSIDSPGFVSRKKNNVSVEHNNNGFTSVQPDNKMILYPRHCQRTIIIRNLPKSATYADVVDNISGGMLLEIQVRPDQTASVSFLFEEDASYFHRHVKRNDMYIRDKRVDISWAHNHFNLGPHVADKIANGATRNLVVHSIDRRHTEEAIREHAEHIHNLVVIDVKFVNDNAIIRTNSVHNAMFLKTCLNSRAMYKQTKVVWGVDECAVPIEPKKKPVKKDSGSEKSALNPMANRFEVLNTDGTEMDSEDDHDTSGFTFLTPPSIATAGR